MVRLRRQHLIIENVFGWQLRLKRVFSGHLDLILEVLVTLHADLADIATICTRITIISKHAVAGLHLALIKTINCAVECCRFNDHRGRLQSRRCCFRHVEWLPHTQMS